MCFLSYIPDGNPYVWSSCSRLCVRVYMSSFLGLRSASVPLCPALLFLWEWLTSCSSSIEEFYSRLVIVNYHSTLCFLTVSLYALSDIVDSVSRVFTVSFGKLCVIIRQGCLVRVVFLWGCWLVIACPTCGMLGLCWGGGLVVWLLLWGGGVGVGLQLAGISKALKILLGDIVCSSFRWLFFVNCVNKVSLSGVMVCSFALAL